MALAIATTGSTPVNGTSASATTSLTTGSFTPTASSLLLAAWINTENNNLPSSVSGGSLTWVTGPNLKTTSAGGSAIAIYFADVSSAASMTFTANYSSISDSRGYSLFVLNFTGAAAAASQAGTVVKSAVAGTVNFHTGVTLGSAASTSWVLGFAADFEAADTPTFPSGQTDSLGGITQLLAISATGDSMWVQGNTAVGNSNLVMNVTTPNRTGTESLMMGLEVQAGAAGPSPQPNPVVTTWPQAMFRSAYR